MEQTEPSETSAYKIQTPGNYPEENKQNLSMLHLYIGSISFVIYQQCMVKDCLKLTEILFITDVTSNNVLIVTAVRYRLRK